MRRMQRVRAPGGWLIVHTIDGEPQLRFQARLRRGRR